MSREVKPFMVKIKGGDSEGRKLLGELIEAALGENTFQSVHLYYPDTTKAENSGQNTVTVYDAINCLRPQLFEVPVFIIAQPDDIDDELIQLEILRQDVLRVSQKTPSDESDENDADPES